jgi:hypothetical protein
MSEKIYVRKVERYTVYQATEPIEVDVEKLRQCEPPYEGNSNEELWEYLENSVYNNYDWFDTNSEVYGEDEAYDLTFQEAQYNDPYSDSRFDFEDSWVELGQPNEEYRRVGGFESFHDNQPTNQW